MKLETSARIMNHPEFYNKRPQCSYCKLYLPQHDKCKLKMYVIMDDNYPNINPNRLQTCAEFVPKDLVL